MTTATYETDDIQAIFTANMVKVDYGVTGSPTWYEPQDIAIDTLSIAGVEVDFDQLPKNLQHAILELADDLEFEG